MGVSRKENKEESGWKISLFIVDFIGPGFRFVTALSCAWRNVWHTVGAIVKWIVSANVGATC